MLSSRGLKLPFEAGRNVGAPGPSNNHSSSYAFALPTPLDFQAWWLRPGYSWQFHESRTTRWNMEKRWLIYQVCISELTVLKAKSSSHVDQLFLCHGGSFWFSCDTLNASMIVGIQSKF